MENHGRGARGVGDRVMDARGQSTTEFLLVAMALAAMAIGLAAMWRAAESGRLLSLATASASHSSESGIVSLLKDLAGY